MPTQRHHQLMVSLKRRALETPSSPRYHKQPRLSPQHENANLSQPVEKKGNLSWPLPSWIRTAVSQFFPFTFSAPISSSPHPPSEHENSYQAYSIVRTPVRSISPKGRRKQRHGRKRSSSSSSPNQMKELSLSFNSFREQRDASLSTFTRHHAPSSSVTTTHSNSQPSSGTESDAAERLLVAKVDNIRLQSNPSSMQSSELTSSSFSRGSTLQSKETSSGPRKSRVRPHTKPHVHHRKFKKSVREENQKALKLRLYQVMKHHRKLINARSEVAAMNLEDYQLLLGKLVANRTGSLSLRTNDKSPRTSGPYNEPDNVMKRTIANAKATLNSPKPSVPFTPSHEQRKLRDRIKDAELERRLISLPEKLPQKEEEEVAAILCKRGVIAKVAREQVLDADISRLSPGQWLNDEIVNFYGALILARSESNKENMQADSKSGVSELLNVHYFSTFFWTKLTKEGYQQGRLAKWTKKIDIFSKDVILIPINHSNAHWTAAAINFRKKRLESYDSMGIAKQLIFNKLREYLDAEHKDKKKKPFEFTDWQNVAPEDTPRQENGWDCGVFTCHFLEALSRGVERFPFAQRDMEYLRKRMIWEIGNAELRKHYK